MQKSSARRAMGGPAKKRPSAKVKAIGSALSAAKKAGSALKTMKIKLKFGDKKDK